MRVLGINDGHGSSVAVLDVEPYLILIGGTGFPKEAFERGEVTMDGIDAVALATIVQGTRETMLKQLSPRLHAFYEGNLPFVRTASPRLFKYLVMKRNRERIAQVRALGFSGPVYAVEHHIAHAASAYYSSPWKESPVLVLTLDGAGDGLCATVNIGEGGKLRRIAQTTSENSLGYFYGHVAGMLDMTPQEVMDAEVARAMPSHAESLRALREYIGLDGLEFVKKFSEPIHELPRRVLNEILRFGRADVAVGLQRLTEELVLEWVRRAVRETGISRVAAAGGVFLNTKANHIVRSHPDVKAFFVPPHPGDESTSLGAAQWVRHGR